MKQLPAITEEAKSAKGDMEPVRTNGYFTKIPDQLVEDLQMGLLTFDEYGLLVYLLQKADKTTSIVVTNSRSLVNQLNADRAWVHNRLTALKRKKRIQSATRSKPELNQKRGNTKPYAMRLKDHIPLNEKTRVKPEANQNLTRVKPLELTRAEFLEPANTAPPLEKTENGKILAKKDKDKETTTEGGGGVEKTPHQIQTIAGDIRRLSGMVLQKWHHQLTAGPSDGHCRQAIESVDGDVEVLLEALERAPMSFNGNTPAAALRFVVNIVKNNWYGVNKTVASKMTYEEELAQYYERDVAWMETLYNDYKDGVLPETTTIPLDAECVYTQFYIKIREAERLADDLTFTVADFESVMELWKGRGA